MAVAATRFPPCEEEAAALGARDEDDGEFSLKSLEQHLSASLRLVSPDGSHHTSHRRPG